MMTTHWGGLVWLLPVSHVSRLVPCLMPHAYCLLPVACCRASHGARKKRLAVTLSPATAARYVDICNLSATNTHYTYDDNL